MKNIISNVFKKKKPVKAGIREKQFTNSSIAESSQDILSRQMKKIEDIRESLSLRDDQFKRLYSPLFHNLAEVSQCFPASENHHHAHKYGFIDHTLEVLVVALRFREGVIYKQDQESQLMTKREVFSYAVAVAAIMHDIGKLITDIEIFSVEQHKIINIATGERLSAGEEYVYRFYPGRRIEDHKASALILLNQIVPQVGLAWLCAEAELFREVIHTITSSHQFSGIVGEIILKADKKSTANNLSQISVNFQSNRTIPSQSNAVQMMNKTKSSISQNAQNKASIVANSLLLMLKSPTEFGGRKQLNVGGSFAWVKDEFIYMAHPMSFGLLQEFMTSENSKNTPHSANICYSILYESGFLIKSNEKMYDFYNVKSNEDEWNSALAFIKLDRDKLDPSRELIESIHPITLSKSRAEASKSRDEVTKGEEATPKTPGATKKTKKKKPAAKSNKASKKVEQKEPRSPDTHNNDVMINTVNSTDNIVDEILAPVDIAGSTLSEEPAHSSNEVFNLFLEWLTHRFRHKTIDINKPNALAHVVENKLALASPRIFMDFSKSNKGKEYFTRLNMMEKTNKQKINHVQEEFFKANEHVRSVMSENILSFSVNGGSNAGAKLTCVLLKDDITNYLLNGESFNNSRNVFLETPVSFSD